jgi:hypothetical protein
VPVTCEFPADVSVIVIFTDPTDVVFICTCVVPFPSRVCALLPDENDVVESVEEKVTWSPFNGTPPESCKVTVTVDQVEPSAGPCVEDTVV